MVDQSTRTKLGNLESPLELCDEAGRVLGIFTPAADPAVYQGVDSPTSPEELRRREEQGGGRPLSEILADLEQKAN
ncbi:MAG: hypothetical protein CMJ64_14680 [Planctomycetaceae bacterium]|nr:hypothetical protein [Planctomycetaceae bacterium]